MVLFTYVVDRAQTMHAPKRTIGQTERQRDGLVYIIDRAQTTLGIKIS